MLGRVGHFNKFDLVVKIDVLYCALYGCVHVLARAKHIAVYKRTIAVYKRA